YDFLVALRELETRVGMKVATPVVALTAYAAGDDRARALEFGFVAHLAKPFSPEHLERVLLRVLRAYREEGALADVDPVEPTGSAPREQASRGAAETATPGETPSFSPTPTAERRYRS